jgi:hypothetical protein
MFMQMVVFLFFFFKVFVFCIDIINYLCCFFSPLADVNIESPPSMHPPLRICDITGFEVCVSVEMCLVLELADEIHHYF